MTSILSTLAHREATREAFEPNCPIFCAKSLDTLREHAWGRTSSDSPTESLSLLPVELPRHTQHGLAPHSLSLPDLDLQAPSKLFTQDHTSRIVSTERQDCPGCPSRASGEEYFITPVCSVDEHRALDTKPIGVSVVGDSEDDFRSLDQAEDEESIKFSTSKVSRSTFEGDTICEDVKDRQGDETSSSAPFRRWVSTLRRRKAQTVPNVTPHAQRWTLEDFEARPSPPAGHRTHHTRSSSCGSSFGFVTTMKSTTATLASLGASAATVSRRNTRRRRNGQHSSVWSGSDARPSVDSGRSVVDEAVKQRSRKRREKLEELIRTEESYVADVKALLDAYCTILSHQPTSVSYARSSAQKNIAEILRLHDELLGQLFLILPDEEYDQRRPRALPISATTKCHTRWHSIDTVPALTPSSKARLTVSRARRHSLHISRGSEDEHSQLQCTPHMVAVVAKIFGAHINRFSLYEEYGAKYELVQRDIEEVQRTIATWHDYDRAIEAISAHINPVKSRESNRKKAMTIKDLLIKPIQRLPRYELLFNDLCKLTPVCDDPDSNASIRSVLAQINKACQKMNKAKEDRSEARNQEATWILSDRIVFPKQISSFTSWQQLGQVKLCGCLHLAWRGKDRIRGMYMVCVLFQSTLILATVDDDSLRYEFLAGMPLANASIVEADNGQGLQCFTAAYSWKVVAEYASRMYELLFTACSAIEEDVWRKHIKSSSEAENRAMAEGKHHAIELHSPFFSDIRSIGKAFGKPSGFVQQTSVHRAATVGPTSEINQVIIKNTRAVKEPMGSTSNASLQLPRSQSVATPSHVQTLAPRRADRLRLESLLSDVWSKDLLPYPGMAPRRTDPIRASANHVIRKFSMTSITSNFSYSKRSTSYTGIERSRNKEDHPPAKLTKSNIRPPLIDFHNTPEAFLPTDFELNDPAATAKRKRSALRTLTMTMERPFSPLLGGGGGSESRSSSALRRAQSVRQTSAQSTLRRAATDNEATTPAAVMAMPVYSVARDERAKLTKRTTPNPPPPTQVQHLSACARPLPDEVLKSPRKNKSRTKLLKLFV